jgi:hypothetical protein
MPSSWMLHRVALVRTDVSEKHIVSIINGFLRSMLRLIVTAIVVRSSVILSTLIIQVIRSSETSVLTRARQRDIPEDGILHT